MHNVYKIDFLNYNKYGFTPQKSMMDAATAVKQFIEPEVERGTAVMASLELGGRPY